MLSHGGTERELSRGRTLPRSTGSIASLDPRPLDPKREGPSEADIRRADAIHAEELISDFLKKQKGRDFRLVFGTSVLTATAIIGGQAILSKVSANEPIEPTLAPPSEDINSIGPTSFNNETLQPIEKFDNTATKGEINERNSIIIEAKEYNKIGPPFVENNEANIPFGIWTKDGYRKPVRFREINRRTQDGSREGIMEIHRLFVIGLGDDIKPGNIIKTFIPLDLIDDKYVRIRIGQDENGYVRIGQDENGNEVSATIHTGSFLTKLLNRTTLVENETGNFGEVLYEYEFVESSIPNLLPYRGQLLIAVKTDLIKSNAPQDAAGYFAKEGINKIKIPTIDNKAIVLK